MWKVIFGSETSVYKPSQEELDQRAQAIDSIKCVRLLVNKNKLAENEAKLLTMYKRQARLDMMRNGKLLPFDELHEKAVQRLYLPRVKQLNELDRGTDLKSMYVDEQIRKIGFLEDRIKLLEGYLINPPVKQNNKKKRKKK